MVKPNSTVARALIVGQEILIREGHIREQDAKPIDKLASAYWRRRATGRRADVAQPSQD